MSALLLELDLSAGYRDQPVLDRVQLTLDRGDRLGVVGASGAGKSTLVLALIALLRWSDGWTRGTILFEGRNLLGLPESELRRIRGRRIALVPQSPTSALNRLLTLRGHFAEAWRAHADPRSSQFQQRVAELIHQVRLPADRKFLDRRPGEISVGQAQRIVIALALLHRPALLIADEPTSALDPEVQLEVQMLLHQASEQDGSGLIYVSHDLLSVLQLCRRMAVLHRGSVVECLQTDGIERHASHPITRSLLQTLPVPPSVIAAYAAQLRSEAAADAGSLSPVEDRSVAASPTFVGVSLPPFRHGAIAAASSTLNVR